MIGKTIAAGGAVITVALAFAALVTLAAPVRADPPLRAPHLDMPFAIAASLAISVISVNSFLAMIVSPRAATKT